jgi:hypothetical protein
MAVPFIPLGMLGESGSRETILPAQPEPGQRELELRSIPGPATVALVRSRSHCRTMLGSVWKPP